MIRRGNTRGPTPVREPARGKYVLTTDTVASANASAATGFTTTPPGTPNPSNQQTTGQVIGSLPRSNAVHLVGASGTTVLFPIGSLAPYFGWVDLKIFWAFGSSDNLFPNAMSFVATNGRTSPIPSTQTPMRALFDTLTQLIEPVSGGAFPIDFTYGFPGVDLFSNLNPNGLRLWLPPGQNDLWLFCRFFDPLESALMWWTAIAGPATEAAIPAQG